MLSYVSLPNGFLVSVYNELANCMLADSFTSPTSWFYLLGMTLSSISRYVVLMKSDGMLVGLKSVISQDSSGLSIWLNTAVSSFIAVITANSLDDACLMS